MALSCSPSMDTKAAKYDENIVGPCSFNITHRHLNITNNFRCPLGKKVHTFSLNSTRLTRNTVKINSLYGPLTECLYQWGLTVYVKGTAMKLIILPQASRIHVYALQIKHETKLE